MESLLLSCRALASPTICRFIPALSVPGFPRSVATGNSSFWAATESARKTSETFRLSLGSLEPNVNDLRDVPCHSRSQFLPDGFG